jgi:hypothetical protein
MGKYARIKPYTDIAVPWLLETASAHGMYTVSFPFIAPTSNRSPDQTLLTHRDPGSHVQPAPESVAEAQPSPPALLVPTKKSGRLKGKARKVAKQPQQAPLAAAAASAPKDTPITHKVTTEELLRHAKFFDALGESLLMPKTVWCAFKDAISGRQAYAAYTALVQYLMLLVAAQVRIS